MKKVILYFSLIVASGVAVTNLYTSIVDAASWGSDIPVSIETARQYFKSYNPGSFFRIFSPLTQFLALACVIVFWRQGKSVRIPLIAAFVLYFLAEGLTFMYFFPRNNIMFTIGAPMDVEKIRATWQEWSNMNWVRTFIIATGVICTATALHRLYNTDSK